MRISDWSSDVCSSDLMAVHRAGGEDHRHRRLVRADGLVGQHDMPGAAAHGILGFGTDTLERVAERTLTSRDREGAVDLRRGLLGVFHHPRQIGIGQHRSEEHTSELQSLMRISYAVFCLKKKKKKYK